MELLIAHTFGLAALLCLHGGLRIPQPGERCLWNGPDHLHGTLSQPDQEAGQKKGGQPLLADSAAVPDTQPGVRWPAHAVGKTGHVPFPRVSRPHGTFSPNNQWTCDTSGTLWPKATSPNVFLSGKIEKNLPKLSKIKTDNFYLKKLVLPSLT